VTYYGFPDGGTYEFSYTSFPEPQSGPIPTVGEWGIIILSMLLAGSSLWIRRRRIRHS
jgi:hypothetical protein